MMKFYLFIIFMIAAIPSIFAQISLSEKGWHLVHLGKHDDVQIFMNSHPNIHSIWHWQENQWAVKFRTPRSSPYAKLTQLKAKRGYWIRIDGNVTLSENFEAWVTHAIDFEDIGKTGWHLLGTSVTLEVQSFFDSALSEQGTVWQWKNQHWQVFTKGDTEGNNQFNQEYNTAFGNLRTLEAHQGFWVNFNVCGGGTPVQFMDPTLEQCFADTMELQFPLNVTTACSLTHLRCETTESLIMNEVTGVERFEQLQELEISAQTLEILEGVTIGGSTHSIEKLTIQTEGDFTSSPNSLIQVKHVALEAKQGNVYVGKIDAETLKVNANGSITIYGIPKQESIFLSEESVQENVSGSLVTVTGQVEAIGQISGGTIVSNSMITIGKPTLPLSGSSLNLSAIDLTSVSPIKVESPIVTNDVSIDLSDYEITLPASPQDIIVTPATTTDNITITGTGNITMTGGFLITPEETTSTDLSDYESVVPATTLDTTILPTTTTGNTTIGAITGGFLTTPKEATSTTTTNVGTTSITTVTIQTGSTPP